MWFIGSPSFREYWAKDTGMIMEKLLVEEKQIEDNPTEKRTEEDCENLVSLLKVISDCQHMNNNYISESR